MTAFEFEAPVWKWSGGGAASWHFITLPFAVTDEIDELAIPDTGAFSLPAGSLKSNSGEVEVERIRLDRQATVIPTGAVGGSQMRVQVRNEVEVLIQATGL